MLVDKFPQKRQRLRPVKPPFLLTIDEQDYGWKAPDLVLTCQPHVFAGVDLDLGQLEATGVFRDQGFQFWRDQHAGHAPVGPQIDQDRHII